MSFSRLLLFAVCAPVVFYFPNELMQLAHRLACALAWAWAFLTSIGPIAYSLFVFMNDNVPQWLTILPIVEVVWVYIIVDSVVWFIKYIIGNRDNSGDNVNEDKSAGDESTEDCSDDDTVRNVPRDDTDSIVSGNVPDSIVSGNVPDSIVSGNAPDSIVSGNAPDSIVSGNAPDSIVSGNAPDSIVSGNAPDSIVSGNAPDSIVSGNAPDSIVSGNAVNDAATGRAAPVLNKNEGRKHNKRLQVLKEYEIQIDTLNKEQRCCVLQMYTCVFAVIFWPVYVNNYLFASYEKEKDKSELMTRHSEEETSLNIVYALVIIFEMSLVYGVYTGYYGKHRCIKDVSDIIAKKKRKEEKLASLSKLKPTFWEQLCSPPIVRAARLFAVLFLLAWWTGTATWFFCILFSWPVLFTTMLAVGYLLMHEIVSIIGGCEGGPQFIENCRRCVVIISNTAICVYKKLKDSFIAYKEDYNAKRAQWREAEKAAEEDARHQREEEALRQRRVEEEALRQRDEDARHQREEDARHQREENARRRVEEDARRQREEAAEEDARRQREEDARRQREEDDRHQRERGRDRWLAYRRKEDARRQRGEDAEEEAAKAERLAEEAAEAAAKIEVQNVLQADANARPKLDLFSDPGFSKQLAMGKKSLKAKTKAIASNAKLSAKPMTMQEEIIQKMEKKKKIKFAEMKQASEDTSDPDW